MSEAEKKLWAAIDGLLDYVRETAPTKYSLLEAAMVAVDKEQAEKAAKTIHLLNLMSQKGMKQ